MGRTGRTASARSPARAAAAAIAGAVIAASGCSAGADDQRSARPPADDREVDVLGTVIERPTRPSSSSTTTTSTPTTTTEGPAAVRERPVAPPVVGPESPPGSSPPATTSPTCDERDDDCDGWWWSTPPTPDQPITMTIVAGPYASSGSEVIISIHAEDPDALIQAPLVCISMADGTAMQGYVGEQPLHEACLAPAVQCERPEGEVVTPVAVSSSGDWTIRHRMGDPGVYYVDVRIDSRSAGGAYCPDPYASSMFERRGITVKELTPG